MQPGAVGTQYLCCWLQGRPLDPNNEANIKNVRGTECAKIAWHPLLPLLAIGWKDGELREARGPSAGSGRSVMLQNSGVYSRSICVYEGSRTESA